MVKIKEGFREQRLVRFPAEVIRRSKDIPFLRDLYITDIGSFPQAPNHYIERLNGYPHHTIIYNTSGSGWCNINGNRYSVLPKHAFLIPANTPHTYASDEKAPWSIYWIHFNGSRANDLLSLINPDADKNPRIYVPRSNAIIEAFEDTYRWTSRSLSDTNLIAMAGSFSRLASLFVAHQRSSNIKTQKAEERILKSIQHMQKLIKQPLTLDELARQASLSVPHYSSLFKKQTGSSPLRFFVRLKMQHACQLLDNTNAPVNQICEEVGYEDSLHFSRMFKKIVGTSPTEYRKLM